MTPVVTKEQIFPDLDGERYLKQALIKNLQLKSFIYEQKNITILIQIKQVKSYLDIMGKGFPGKKLRGGIYFIMAGQIIWLKDVDVLNP